MATANRGWQRIFRELYKRKSVIRNCQLNIRNNFCVFCDRYYFVNNKHALSASKHDVEKRSLSFQCVFFNTVYKFFLFRRTLEARTHTKFSLLCLSLSTTLFQLRMQLAHNFKHRKVYWSLVILLSYWIHKLFVFGSVDALNNRIVLASTVRILVNFSLWCTNKRGLQFYRSQETKTQTHTHRKREKKRNNNNAELGKATENNVSGFTGSSTHSRFFSSVVVFFFLHAAICAVIPFHSFLAKF